MCGTTLHMSCLCVLGYVIFLMGFDVLYGVMVSIFNYESEGPGSIPGLGSQ